MMQEAITKALAQQQQQAGATDGPRYGSATYGQAFYPTVDPALPVSDGAKIKMDLGRRTIDNIIAYIGNHIAMTTDNVNFLVPQPPAPAFLTLFQSLQAAQVKNQRKLSSF